MNERIVFTNIDGSCGVIIPTGEISVAEVMAKDAPITATNIRQITINELPQDRLFRSAWDDSNLENFIGTNLTKAKLIAHDMRRINRETKLEPLDKEEVFLSTTQSRKAEIIVEKQAILDANTSIQLSIDNALTESDLRTVLTTAGITQ